MTEAISYRRDASSPPRNIGFLVFLNENESPGASAMLQKNMGVVGGIRIIEMFPNDKHVVVSSY